MSEKEKNILLHILKNEIIKRQDQLNNAKARQPETTKKQTIKAHYKRIDIIIEKIQLLYNIYDNILAS